MHSGDPDKDREGFKEEIQHIRDGSSKYKGRKDRHDFSGFVFPVSEFPSEVFSKDVYFVGAAFLQGANFRETAFERDADFRGVKFGGDAYFHGTTFSQDADFAGAIFARDGLFDRAAFRKDAYFMAARFSARAAFCAAAFSRDADFTWAALLGEPDFMGAIFARDVYLSEVTFGKNAAFGLVRFDRNVSFRGARFTRGGVFESAVFAGSSDFAMVAFGSAARFSRADFTKHAGFKGAKFMEAADFSESGFKQAADFSNATFVRGCCFSRAVFDGPADFRGALFSDDAVFLGATFERGVDFSYTAFRVRDRNVLTDDERNESSHVVADFRSVRLARPSEVRFFQVNKSCEQGLLGRFLNAEVENVDFTDVHWHVRGRRMVLGDEVDVRGGASREYGLVAKAYRQLMNNFERVRDYDLAEDCFIGAMEMKRLDPRKSVLGSVGRWLSVTNLYRILSIYGSSYGRATVCLAVFIVCFGLLYSLLGLRFADGPLLNRQRMDSTAAAAPPTISWRVRQGTAHLMWGPWGTFVGGVWASLEVATFQRDETVTPATLAGRRLAVLEHLLIPGQLALLLLALRRRFRR